MSGDDKIKITTTDGTGVSVLADGTVAIRFPNPAGGMTCDDPWMTAAETEAILTSGNAADYSLLQSEQIQFRDAVIAGLRERGWPEPHAGAEADGFMCGEMCWSSPEFPLVWFAVTEPGPSAGYETKDDNETGRIDFDEDAVPERVVEAIDRLRWVIGLRSGIIFPLPRDARDRPHSLMNTPSHDDCYCAWCSEKRSAVAFGISYPDYVTRRDAAIDKALLKLKHELTHETLAGGDPLPADARLEGGARSLFQNMVRRVGIDPDGPLVAMTPSKLAPGPDQPYMPTRWIGGGGE